MLRNTLVSIACLAAVTLAHGKEVAPGTVLNKASIDGLLNDTLDGKTIKSMITDKMEWMIRNQDFAMKLVPAKKIVIDPIWHEANKKSATTVTYDAKSRAPVGWKAGLPFPNIDMKDPAAGDKIAWNSRYGLAEGASFGEPYAHLILIDLGKGVERFTTSSLVRVHLNGRMGRNTPVQMGDPAIFSKTLQFLTYPQDTNGIGVFTIRYMDPNRADDKWVYINQLRRTKRVSGGGWMDPLPGGNDFITEDLNVWEGLPQWYPSVKLVAKRWLLSVANAANPPMDLTKPKHTLDEMPYSELKKAPFINSLNGYEPREVYELEVLTHVEHPYGKRVVFIDAEIFQTYHTEIYDKKGEFFKTINYERTPITYLDGFQGYAPVQGRIIDFKRRHATVWAANWVGNDPKVSERTITLEALERGSGQ